MDESSGTNLLLVLRPARCLHCRPRAGRAEGPQHLHQVQGALRRLPGLHGGGHGVLHQALPVQEDDPLKALALLLVEQIKAGGQVTARIRPERETQAAAQTSVLPGSSEPGAVTPGGVRGAGHHRGPGLGEPLLQAGEGEEELVRRLLPVPAVEEEDEVTAAVLRQTVRRLSALVNTRDVAGRTRT